MKTLQLVLAENKQHSKLINAVVSQLGYDDLEYLYDIISSINKHGIMGGYGGFIYYKEIIAFTDKYHKDILKLLEEQADDFGVNSYLFITSFHMLKDLDADDRKDIHRFLAGLKCQGIRVSNALAWYAAEEVCQMFED